MTRAELKEFLDEKAAFYNRVSFIETDPIQIPHLFTKKEDIEIAGFLTATIAWGNRKSIITNATRLMELMDHSPYEFVMDYNESASGRFSGFVHRTFNETDVRFFMTSLRNIYTNHGGLEATFLRYAKEDTMQPAIHEFKKLFFELPHESRTEKHVSDPMKNSAAKRINILSLIINAANIRLFKMDYFFTFNSNRHLFIR